MNSLPRCYTVDEVAESLRKSSWWVRQQVKAGRLPAMRTSDTKRAQMLFEAADVEQLKASLREPAPVTHPNKRRRRRAT